jgi:hypothetical protein
LEYKRSLNLIAFNITNGNMPIKNNSAYQRQVFYINKLWLSTYVSVITNFREYTEKVATLET